MSYLPGVTSGKVIQIPAAGADRLRPIKMVCIGVLGLGLGMAISASVHTPHRAPISRGAPSLGRIAPNEALGKNDRRQEAGIRRSKAGTQNFDGGVKGKIQGPPSLSNEALAERLRVKVPTGPGFQYGRVAYIRCDGLTQRRGAYGPCPRDTALELAVWRILQGITTCPTANAGVGYADVRLDFKRGQRTSVRVLIPANQTPGLIRNAVYECVGKPLTSLKTSLNPLYMIVSFRFAIEPIP